LSGRIIMFYAVILSAVVLSVVEPVQLVISQSLE